MGTVVGDLNAKRGQIQEMIDRAGSKAIRAFVPLAEMFGWATQLRSMTQVRAIFDGVRSIRVGAWQCGPKRSLRHEGAGRRRA